MPRSESELRRFIETLATPWVSEDERGGRFGYLHQLIRQREQHFFNRPEADQKLRPPFEDMDVFQSDVLRRVWVRMKSRLTESPPTVKIIPPRKTEKATRDANQLETVLQRGLELVQERGNFSIQGELSDGQIYQSHAVLHWRKATDVWPDFPEMELLDDLPEEEDEKARFGSSKNKDGKYEETDVSLNDRDRRAKARAGFPFHIEVIHPGQFSFIEERSVASGMGMTLTLRSTPLVDYSDELRSADSIEVSLNAENTDINILEEKDRPADWEPSYDQRFWSHSVTVAQIWDRDYFYELVALGTDAGGGSSGFKLVKSERHYYGFPPFALVKAHETKSNDPGLRFSPAMEGLYRIKPFYDYERSLGRAIAEQIALPYYWIKLSDGAYELDEEGNRIVLSQNTMTAQVLPAGATLEKVEFTMNPALVEFLQLTKSELEEASPQTGHVEVGASTAPWTIRLSHDQANTEVKTLKSNQATGYRVMLRSIIDCMSRDEDEGGIGHAIHVYQRSKAGHLLTDDTIGVEPEDIHGLEVEVHINPMSSSQVIAQMEHGRALLGDPFTPWPTRKDWLEQFAMQTNPEEKLEEWLAEQVYDAQIQPQVITQELAKRFGDVFVVTPEGQFVGPGGQLASPDEVLASRGGKVTQPRVPGDVQAESQQMPSMPPLRTNQPSTPVSGGTPT
jgi:hypothetical protein